MLCAVCFASSVTCAYGGLRRRWISAHCADLVISDGFCVELDVHSSKDAELQLGEVLLSDDVPLYVCDLDLTWSCVPQPSCSDTSDDEFLTACQCLRLLDTHRLTHD